MAEQGPEVLMSPKGPSAPQPSAGGVVLPDLLAAANMRRLLEAYRSLAPLTIGGPSSTSLETPGTPNSLRPPGPPPDPRFIRKFAHYPWLMGCGAPPHPLFSPKSDTSDMARRRHASCDSHLGPRATRHLSGSQGPPGPQTPLLSTADRESSR